jgi:type II secretory pathway pseudopilin PulG
MHGEPMRFLRLRLRSLVVLIVLGGLCLGGVVLWRRSVEYSRLAWIAENDEAEARQFLADAAAVADDEEASQGFLMMVAMHVRPQPGAAKEQLARLTTFMRHRLDHYASLASKYRRAARRPWLLVLRDPPLPEIPAEFAVP